MLPCAIISESNFAREFSASGVETVAEGSCLVWLGVVTNGDPVDGTLFPVGSKYSQDLYILCTKRNPYNHAIFINIKIQPAVANTFWIPVFSSRSFEFYFQRKQFLNFLVNYLLGRFLCFQVSDLIADRNYLGINLHNGRIPTHY